MSLRATPIHLLNTSREGDSTTSLNSLFQSLTTLLVKFFFVISSLNLTWHNLRSFPFAILLASWDKRLTPTSLQPPFQVAVENNNVPLEPPFFQPKQPQLPQLLPKILVSPFTNFFLPFFGLAIVCCNRRFI